MTFRQDFANDFSSSAFRRIDGEMHIVGKWGSIVQLEDGTYDAWFVGPDLSPLSPQKIAAIRQKAPLWLGLKELDGEACAQGAGRDFVLTAARLAGVRKKRRVSKENPGWRAGAQENGRKVTAHVQRGV